MNSNIIKTVAYSKNIFRADPRNSNEKRGNNHYSEIPFHFFTTNVSEVEPYTAKGTTYTKTWKVIRPLILIDILDLGTRLQLENFISKKNLDIAFPIIDGKVYRVSEADTAKIDGQIVNDICGIPGRTFDGYYMKKQSEDLPSGILKFHSEITLCKNAFDKLELITSIMKKEPPKGPNQSRSRSRLYNNNNRKTSRLFSRSLFANNNNGNNKNILRMSNLRSPNNTRKNKRTKLNFGSPLGQPLSFNDL